MLWFASIALVVVVMTIATTAMNSSSILVGYSPPLLSNNTGAILGNSASLFTTFMNISSDNETSRLVSERLEILRQTQKVPLFTSNTLQPIPRRRHRG